ncbi:MAPEG family protein [Trinickia dinghuensis]|uniref:MAPEG family protein n=1 Tax=Trinickia dinghuensis TaxID=2291023 RepID=A0A3D8JTT1_9BURK|nr:MAPEG family protein [Trinickia dinghuensis]RDU96509.1 hypothetical protein DWV00_23235 [Trinickia dinghuensis]
MSEQAHDWFDFRRQRKVGIVAIAAASFVALTLWVGIDQLMTPLVGMDSLGARMLLTLKCVCVAVLFCLVTGIEAVAHERLRSPAFDPLTGFETRRLRINLRYLQNTVEQTIVFGVALFGLAAYSFDGAAMRAVVATTVVWIVARAAFWLGYHRSAALRGLGAPSMAISMIVLLYVASRFGREIAGVVGAAVPVVAFLAIEAVLFWGTRPSTPRR